VLEERSYKNNRSCPYIQRTRTVVSDQHTACRLVILAVSYATSAVVLKPSPSVVLPNCGDLVSGQALASCIPCVRLLGAFILPLPDLFPAPFHRALLPHWDSGLTVYGEAVSQRLLVSGRRVTASASLRLLRGKLPYSDSLGSLCSQEPHLHLLSIRAMPHLRVAPV
jgi:hypothetical protein